MTKTEIIETQELGLTPEQLAAKTSRMEELAREAKHVPPMTLGEVMRSEEREVPAPKQRKKRADAGIAKGPRKPAVEGTLTNDQVVKLYALMKDRDDRETDAFNAKRAARDAQDDLDDFINGLRSKA